MQCRGAGVTHRMTTIWRTPSLPQMERTVGGHDPMYAGMGAAKGAVLLVKLVRRLLWTWMRCLAFDIGPLEDEIPSFAWVQRMSWRGLRLGTATRERVQPVGARMGSCSCVTAALPSTTQAAAACELCHMVSLAAWAAVWEGCQETADCANDSWAQACWDC